MPNTLYIYTLDVHICTYVYHQKELCFTCPFPAATMVFFFFFDNPIQISSYYWQVDAKLTGGSGGKGTWGGLLDSEGGYYFDHNDPNYDSSEVPNWTLTSPLCFRSSDYIEGKKCKLERTKNLSAMAKGHAARFVTDGTVYAIPCWCARWQNTLYANTLSH